RSMCVYDCNTNVSPDWARISEAPCREWRCRSAMETDEGETKGSAGYSLLAPEVLEWLFTVAIIAFLVSESAPFRDPAFIRGAADRYREAVELKAPILPEAAGIGRIFEICS